MSRGKLGLGQASISRMTVLQTWSSQNYIIGRIPVFLTKITQIVPTSLFDWTPFRGFAHYKPSRAGSKDARLSWSRTSTISHWEPSGAEPIFENSTHSYRNFIQFLRKFHAIFQENWTILFKKGEVDKNVFRKTDVWSCVMLVLGNIKENATILLLEKVARFIYSWYPTFGPDKW